MKKELAMKLFSRRALTASVAREQITALSDFGGGLVRPEKCSEFEPVRTPFDPADIRKPVQWLAKPGGEFFYTKGKPVHISGEMWNLARRPTAHFPAGPFTNYWTGRFDGRWANQIGIEKIDDFVSEMFRATHSDFGFLTSEADVNAKNRLAPEGQLRSLSYKGLNPATGVPGLYWINFFSHEYADWLNLRELPKELAALKKNARDGVSLKFCDSPDDCRSVEVLQKQQATIEWLGRERFFDIRFPDRKAVAPDWNRLPCGMQHKL